jgi:hypothetical protein
MNELPVRVIPFSKEQCPFDKNRGTAYTRGKSGIRLETPYWTFSRGMGPLDRWTLGTLPILETFEESSNEWHVTTRKPDFFVVDDDMYGNSVRVEASSALVKPPLLDELLMLVLPTHDWSVYLALIKGGLWVI